MSDWGQIWCGSFSHGKKYFAILEKVRNFALAYESQVSCKQKKCHKKQQKTWETLLQKNRFIPM